jgi:hypothetical protein
VEPLWDEVFPVEKARIVRSLVEGVVVGPAGADIRLRLDGLGDLLHDLHHHLALRADGCSLNPEIGITVRALLASGIGRAGRPL